MVNDAIGCINLPWKAENQEEEKIIITRSQFNYNFQHNLTNYTIS